MFSKPEMVRKELYCTKSIISKFAVHRHFNSIFSHKGNIMQNIQFASTKHCGLGKPTPAKSRQGLSSSQRENEYMGYQETG